MHLLIDFLDETEKVKEEEIALLQKVMDYAAKNQGVQADTEVSVTFVTNEKIQEINREYREKDAPTDVISFAMEELGEGEVEMIGGDMPRVLGDIIISIDRAREQAKDYGHSYVRELCFLAVHGFLHLLGYDHETKEDEEEMFGIQRAILDELGIIR